jgi:hypothetical protein
MMAVFHPKRSEAQPQKRRPKQLPTEAPLPTLVKNLKEEEEEEE